MTHILSFSHLFMLLSKYWLQEEIFALNLGRILIFWKCWINWKGIASCSLAIHAPAPATVLRGLELSQSSGSGVRQWHQEPMTYRICLRFC